MNTIQKWWEAVRKYTKASTLGIKQEEVESYLETKEFRDAVKTWDKHLEVHKGAYPQILRGLLHKFPKDRDNQKGNVTKLAGWLDYELHNWGSKKEKGWTLCIYAKGQVLTITRRGKIGWKDVLEEELDA